MLLEDACLWGFTFPSRDLLCLGAVRIIRPEYLSFQRYAELSFRLQNFPANIRCSWILLLAVSSIVLCGCRGPEHPTNRPYIEFTRIPPADEGGPDRLDLIEGRVIGVYDQVQIILYAKSGAWYVQPFADQPVTQVQSDSTWRSTTHLGTEYAALLVEPGYHPPFVIESLPGEGQGVIALLAVKGHPVFWKRWWFVLLCVLAALLAPLALYSYHLRDSSRQLNVRFEERLAERTRVAEDLHDTLLQGVISASMQLQLAVDRLPEDLPAKPSLSHVLQVMGQVVEEGHTALQQLRSSASSDSLDVEQAFSRIRQEFDAEQRVAFRVVVEGRPRLVHPIIRDEVYSIGRKVLVDAFRNSHARSIEVKVEYKAKYLRIIIRKDGSTIDPQEYVHQGGLSGLRERAEGIGARLRVRRHAETGNAVELSVPGDVAFQDKPTRNLLSWLADWYPGNARL